MSSAPSARAHRRRGGDPLPGGPPVDGPRLRDALTHAASYAIELTGADGAAVHLLEGDRLRCWAADGALTGHIDGHLDLASAPEGRVLRTGQPIVSDDASPDEEVLRALGLTAVAIVPLTFAGTPIGTLGVASRQARAFGVGVANVLGQVADSLPAQLEDAACLVERDAAVATLRREADQLQVIGEMLTEGVLAFDRDGRLGYANNAAARILGVSLDQIAGRRVADALRALVHEDGSPWPVDEQPAAITVATGRSARDVIMGVPMPHGVLSWVSVSSRPLHDERGERAGAIVVLGDCNERRSIRDQLDHATLHDELTGLANRRMLHLELDETIERARRQGLGAALVHVSIRDGGEELLRAAAERLRQTMRDGELVARYGALDFVALLGMLGDCDRAVEAFLERVRRRLAEGEGAPLDVTLGATVYPRDGRTSDALLRHVEAAVYAAHSRPRAA